MDLKFMTNSTTSVKHLHLAEDYFIICAERVNGDGTAQAGFMQGVFKEMQEAGPILQGMEIPILEAVYRRHVKMVSI